MYLNVHCVLISDSKSTERGFEGCIYRMEIDNVYPLKRAFQDPRPAFIQIIPNNSKVREDMCGYEEITVSPDPIEKRPIRGGTLVEVTFPTPQPGLTNEEKAGLGGENRTCIDLYLLVHIKISRK